ncbi:MAG: alpha/beta hydrolase [Acidobacteria bacterium]|nr:alpha/beta hydrolase [Acidobacteriota bacterium]
MKPRAWVLILVPALGLGAFSIWKARAVAHELTDPPFYQPQPLPRVEATYADLAKGADGDPGGTWAVRDVEGLRLWTLTRPTRSPGIVLMLHGFGDDRWGTSPALKWFPRLDAAIFTYLRRDDALRQGGRKPFITFGALESQEVVRAVHALEAQGWPRNRIHLMGRSLGASVGLLALAKLEAEGRGPLAGFIWEGAPLGSRDFAEQLIRGPEDRAWHLLAPPIGALAARWAASRGGYRIEETDPRHALRNLQLTTPTLCFLATQDRLAPTSGQRLLLGSFQTKRVVEVPTWHLNCSQVLGPGYAQAIREFTDAGPKKSGDPKAP